MTIPRPTNYIPVHGTGSFRIGKYGDWWHRYSHFERRLREENIILTKPEDVFFWSSALEGVFGGIETWYAGAGALRYYLSDVPAFKRRLIAHSHGGQIVMLCAAGMCYPDGYIRPVPMDTVILVGTPIRKDMLDVYAQARHFIRKIVYIGDAKKDRMQWLGSWFDGDWTRRREWPGGPNVINILREGIGHSGIFEKPEILERAIREGWLEHLR